MCTGGGRAVGCYDTGVPIYKGVCVPHARGFCSNDLSPDAGWSIAAHAVPSGYLKKCRLLFKVTKQFKSRKL